MALENVSIQVFDFAAADRRDEVAEMPVARPGV